MTGNDQARERYLREYERFTEAADAMYDQLQDFLRSLGIRGQVEVRAKTIGSFVKKIHVRSYSDAWTEITDKLGGRVIVKTLDDLDRVRAAFETASPFEVLWLEDKTEEADVATLYYSGVHVQVVVPGLTTSDEERIECELQVRTKAQDLWSVPSHELVYKGVVEPSKETRRRILRLSVLTEMFDQEVRLAMHEVASDPRYEKALLLRAAESLYLSFVAEPGEDELSLEVLEIVMGAIPDRERVGYSDTLTSFVSSHRERLSEVFATYGVYTEFAAQYLYWLFSQPEALVVLERVNSTPHALAETVAGTEVESVVRQLYAAWGTPMPEIV